VKWIEKFGYCHAFNKVVWDSIYKHRKRPLSIHTANTPKRILMAINKKKKSGNLDKNDGMSQRD
jgi:hypothetical protein